MKKTFFYKKIVVVILLISIMAPTAFLAMPHQASAAGLDTIGGPSNILSAVFNGISSAADTISAYAESSLLLKEFVLDSLVPLLREVIIQSLTASIVNWINSGFEGEPAFVTDLEGFLLNIGDEVIGAYIEGSALARLCSPFSADVRISIALDYYTSHRDRAACTLTGVIQNVEDAFGSGGGGWDTWFEFSTNPYNNPLGAFLGSRQALRESIAIRQEQELRTLDWGSGFKSYEVCDTDGVQDPRNSANISVGAFNCRIATPGVVINEQLAQIMPSGFRQLELADEINEIVGALLTQLVSQAFGGSDSGFSGLSQSSGGAPAFTDRLLQERSDSSAVSGRVVQTIGSDLEGENKYRSAKQTSLNAVRTTKGKVQSLQQCYAEKASKNQTFSATTGSGEDQTTTTFTTQELAARAASASSTITNTLVPLETRLEKEIQDSDEFTSRLLAIRAEIQGALSVNDLNTAIGKYTTIQQSGALRDVKEIADAELERDGHPGDDHGLSKGIVRDMAALNSQTDADLKVCQSLIAQ